MKADPIAEALAYLHELVNIGLTPDERRELRRQLWQMRRDACAGRVRAYFHQLNRMGVAIDPRGACPGLPSIRERVVWADIRRLGAAGWGLPEWRKGFRR